jgi:hypothetical protein
MYKSKSLAIILLDTNNLEFVLLHMTTINNLAAWGEVGIHTTRWQVQVTEP